MNEEPKSIWKKSWKGPRGFLLWFILLTVAAFVLILCIGLASAERNPMMQLVTFSLIYAVGFALVGVLMIAFIHWLCCWRNFKRLLFGTACLATFIALFYAEEDWRGKHAWEKFKRECEAKGEKFNFADFVPLPVPDDQNFALTPIVTSSYATCLDKNGHEIMPRNTNVVNRLLMAVDHNYDGGPPNGTGDWLTAKTSDLKVWQNYYRTLAATTNEFPVAAQPQSPAADVLLALSKYDSVLEELRQASQLPYSRFPLNYDTENPAMIFLPHLAALKRCSQTLQLRAIAELQNGQPEKALADVKLALQLADKIHTEPFLISHLVRIAMMNLTLQPIYEGLAEHRWSEEQFVALDAELAKLDFLADYGFATRGERGCGIGIIEYLRHAQSKFHALANLTGGDGGFGNFDFGYAMLAYGPSGWFDQNELQICRFFARWYLPAVDNKERTFSPSAIRAADAAIDPEFGGRNPCNLLGRLLMPALGSWARKCAYAQSSVDLARVAIALERYRLAHGEFPESLDALAPKFMEKIPHDIINGQPLHYRRTSDGQFVLYSVGWNETDDGGEVGLTSNGQNADNRKGDWVWRYPAK